MVHRSSESNINSGVYDPSPVITREIADAVSKPDEFKTNFQQFHLTNLDELLASLTLPAGKKSFLVFKNNKYVNVLTESIAFFYIKYESPVIMCFDKQEYSVKYSLEQIESFLPGKQFFRLNRRSLINFYAVGEVEHYFARRLLVNPVIPMKEKLLVPKRKVSGFLHWLDDR